MKKISIILLTFVLLIGITACGSNNNAESGKLVVAGKNWTEQLILMNIYAEYLKETTDFDISTKPLATETVITEAMKKGQVDLYVEYTGTGFLQILKGDYEPGMSPDHIYDQTKKEYENKFQLTWLEPLGFENTYAIALRKETADRLKVKTVSDLKKKASTLNFGAPASFFEREDGYDGLTKTYGLTFKKKVTLDEDLMYTAIKNENVDVITAFSTDPRIAQFDLVMLEDDKRYFPPYDAAPVVRQEVLKAYPDLESNLNKLAGKISTEKMGELNTRVNIDKKDPKDVAREFLKEEGLID